MTYQFCYLLQHLPHENENYMNALQLLPEVMEPKSTLLSISNLDKYKYVYSYLSLFRQNSALLLAEMTKHVSRIDPCYASREFLFLN